MAQTLAIRNSPLEKLQQHAKTTDELVSLLRQYGLLSQVLREVLIDEAIAPITVTPEETLQACQQFYQRHQLTAEADVQTWMATHELSRPQLDHLITRDARLQRFKQDTWEPKIESYFLERKAKLDRVVYSLIRVKEIGIAQELYFRIQEGEQPFSELASEHSQGIEAETGGLLGPVELSVPHATISSLLTASQPGQLLPPTRLGEWVLILRLEKLLPAQLDESTRQRLMNELFETWLQEEVRKGN